MGGTTRDGRAGRGWAYAGATLGGGVSIAANVAHSYVPPASARPGWAPPAGAVVGAVFWPVALFLAAEILARVAWPAGRRWASVKYLGLLPVALVAAGVSYGHLSGLLTHYGENPLTARIGPLAVDGLMTMATAALLATARERPAAAKVAPLERVDPDRLAAVSETPRPVPATRLRLPAVMRDAVDARARRAAAEGRPLTVADVRDAVRVPEELAARIVAEVGA